MKPTATKGAALRATIEAKGVTQSFPLWETLRSEVVNHPHIRVCAYAEHGEVTPIGRRYSPGLIGLRLVPYGLRVAAQVDVQHRGATRSPGRHKHALRIRRPIKRIEVDVALYRNGASLAASERNKLDLAGVPVGCSKWRLGTRREKEPSGIRRRARSESAVILFVCQRGGRKP